MDILLFIRNTSLQWSVIFGTYWVSSWMVLAQKPIELKIQSTGTQLVLSWPSEWISPAGKTYQPIYELQWSGDLRNWQAVGSLYTVVSGSETKAVLNRMGTRVFYRLVGKIDTILPAGLASSGDEVFGFADAFNVQIVKTGQITPQEFGSIHTVTNSYLPGISWDPTTALYWQQFNQNTNFQLNAKELDLFKKNGFCSDQAAWLAKFCRPLLPDL